MLPDRPPRISLERADEPQHPRNLPVADPAQQLIASMREEMEEFRKSVMASLPRVKLPIKRSRASTIADTPFTESITSVELLRKFSPPDMRLYDGTSDPNDHVVHYKYKMMSMALSQHQWEAGMCMGFGETLAGPALTLFINSSYRSIGSYQELADKFVGHFASSCGLEKTTDDLNSFQQRRGELLRNYVARFNKERISIPDLHQPTVVEAFQNELLADSGFYKKLTKFKCYNLDQAMARAQVEIRWENDKRNKKRDPTSGRQEKKGPKSPQAVQGFRG
ncbi:uncharacterized protein [Palaemon carinicauda]|uniref:uncharacterized protein n=1 Tax=Palaemon carinicauda TaxID=392227 RepID=UPI0035B648C3